MEEKENEKKKKKALAVNLNAGESMMYSGQEFRQPSENTYPLCENNLPLVAILFWILYSIYLVLIGNRMRSWMSLV